MKKYGFYVSTVLIQAQDKVPVGHVETWLLKHATFYYEFYQET